MKILISGWYGFKNAGDELLLDVFMEKNKEHKITVLTQGDISPVKAPSIFHADIFRFDSGGIKQWLSGKTFRLLKAIVNTDVFVLGGGGIIRESGNFTNLKRLLDEIWLCHLLGKKIFIYGVSIGPIQSDKGANMIKKALEKCDFIIVRDAKSVAYLKDFGIDESKYCMNPDPGFIHLPSPHTKLSCLELEKNINEDQRIPLFPALGLIDDGKDLSWLTPLAEALDEVYKRTGKSFISLPFRCLGENKIDDVYIGREIKSRLKNPECLSVYEKELTHDDLSIVMTISRCVVAVRLHSMILAITNKVPFVAINYDTKVYDTAKVAGLDSQVVLLNDDFKKNLEKKLILLIENTENLKNEVIIAADIMSVKAEETFSIFRNVMNKY